MREWASQHGAARALLLGVTPEIATMQWPTDAELEAVDRCPDMICDVWPGFRQPGVGIGTAIGSSCRFRPARDIVVGDGCFNLLRYPDQQNALFRSVERVLSDRGMFLTRAFVRPETRESPHEVLDALRGGSIGNFHIFKFRLLMALHGHTRFGIRTGDVWDFWAKHGPDPKVLAAGSGWPIEEIATIDSYRGQDTHYHFPTFAEQRGC